MMKHPEGPSRRSMLKIAGVCTLGGAIGLPIARQAASSPLQASIAQLIGDAKLSAGRVRLDIPPLVENGNTVPCTVSVESPMTPEDYVKAIHIVSEKNPQPNVISVKLGPRAGRARLSTRIRLADMQTVVALAEMSDGSFWSNRADVIITLGACLEEL